VTRVRTAEGAAELALLASSLVGAAALARMVAAPGVPWAVLATAGAGGAVAVASGRRRWPAPVAAAVPVAVVAVVAVWVSTWRTTVAGVPTARTWHAVDTALRSAHDIIATSNPPYRAVSGIVLLAALTAGIAAVAARLLAGTTVTSPLLALAPPFALVGLSAFAVGGAVAVPMAALAVTGAVVLVAAGGAGRRELGAGSAAVGLAVAVLAAGSVWGGPFVGYRPPSHPAGHGGAGGSGGSGVVTGLALVASVDAVERAQPDVVVFDAFVPQPTYWQVAALDRFDGTSWLPAPGVTALLRGTPPAPTGPPSPGRDAPTSTIVLRSYGSRILPVPPSTVTASGLTGIEVTPSGTVLPTTPTPGDTYTTFASATPTTPGTPAPSPTSDLSLPPLPTVVSTLAHQVTAGATSPAGEAARLTAWFRSGRFAYTLTPPRIPRGTDPLVAFLTTTRAGSCQQFASAFAAMARTLGLQTRVAVGFAPGTTVGGTTVVTGADAHAWPEVYLGPTDGWISFEPTPQLPGGTTVPSGVRTGSSLGPGGGTGPATTTVPPTTTTTVAPPATQPVPATTVPGVGRSRSPGLASSGALGVPATLLAVVAGAVLVVAAAALELARRRRKRRRPPEERIAASWARAERALAATGWTRPPGEPPTAFASRLAQAAAQAVGSRPPGGVPDGMSDVQSAADDLAAALERAAYASGVPTTDDADRAEAALTDLLGTLREPGTRAALHAIAATRVGGNAAARDRAGAAVTSSR
jgi:transglutaminase-like putative cysteine protease